MGLPKITRSGLVFALTAAVCNLTTIVWAQTPAGTPGEYDIEWIGLVGSVYDYNTGTGIQRYTEADQINESGQAVGVSHRYSPSGVNQGADAWFYDGNQTHQIGLIGSVYEYVEQEYDYHYRNSSIVEMIRRYVLGYSARCDASDHVMGRDAWLFDGATTRKVNPEGDIYESAKNSNESTHAELYSNGHVVGYSDRRSNSGFLGRDAWYFDGTNTIILGLTGDSMEYVAYGGTYRHSKANDYDPATGRVIGTNDRFSSTGKNLGISAWVYDSTETREVGMFGDGYEYYSTTATGVYRKNYVWLDVLTGNIYGYAYRFDTAGQDLGRDTWILSDQGSTPIGLLGATYQYTTAGGGIQRYSTAVGSGSTSGLQAGYAKRYNASGDDLGQDAWAYTIATGVSERIGLVGIDYEYTQTNDGTYRYASPRGFTDSGFTAGLSRRYNAAGQQLGQDAWYYDGADSVMIGLTGDIYEYENVNGGVYRNSAIKFQLDNGHVVGTTSRIHDTGASLGVDAWYFDGGDTRLIGLTDSEHEQQNAGTGITTVRNASISSINEDGKVIGWSRRYSPIGTTIGGDAWYFDGNSTRAINPVGNEYEYDDDGGVHRWNTPSQINQLGQVIGFIQRYKDNHAVNGVTAWFYDPQLDHTYTINGSIRTSDQYASTRALYLSDDGVVMGEYELYDGDTFIGDRAYWWTAADGFFDIGDLVPNLTAEGWASLYADLVDNGPQFILGHGLRLDQSDGQSAFVIKPSIQPATIYPVFDARATWNSSSSSYDVADGNTSIATQDLDFADIDRRGIMEFSLGDIPDTALITRATLTLSLSSFTYTTLNGETFYPFLRLLGYRGDGLLDVTDATAATLADLVGASDHVTEIEPITIALDVNFLQTLLGSDDYLGLLAIGDPEGNQINWYALETLRGDEDLPQLEITFDFVSILTGDANNDGVVDAADFLAVEKYMGTVGVASGYLPGDANDDGRVDGRDWLWVEQHFGATLGDGPTVPEPGTGALALLLLARCVVERRGSSMLRC